jgi:ppGpp synthetase/RelA/SpoT-type nucleotidyltranferase
METISGLAGLANNLSILEANSFAIKFYDKQPRRVNGESQYTHIQRVRETLRLVSPKQELSPGFELGILIHDMVDRSLNSTDQLEIDQNTEILTRILEKRAKTNPQMAAYAYGVALSSCAYEKDARRWRKKLTAAITNSTDTESAFLREQIDTIDAVDGEYNLSTKLINVLKPHSNEPVDTELKQFISPVADIKDMIYMQNLYDIEGLKLAAAGMIDNTRHPRNDAACYKDSQELLSYLGPLLELAGMNDIARQCYSTAYEFLYAESPYMNRAKELYTQAIECENSSNYQYRVPDIIMGAIQHELKKIHKDSDIFLSSRKKKPGSIAKKLTDKKVYAKLRNIPDLMAMRVILNNQNITANQMMDIAQNVVLALQQVNPDLLPEHINPQDPCIQANYKGLEQLSPLEATQKYHYTTTQEGPRNAGYQAFHINFQLPLSAITDKEKDAWTIIPFELQLLQQEQHMENTYGVASHIFYKLKNAFGETGRACRKFFAAPKQNREEFMAIVNSYRKPFEKIFERANYFHNHLNSKKNTKDYKLTPHVIETVRFQFERMGIEIDDKVYEALRLNGEKSYYSEP